MAARTAAGLGAGGAAGAADRGPLLAMEMTESGRGTQWAEVRVLGTSEGAWTRGR